MEMEIRAHAKKHRMGKPKVRTGCLICKARKIKCDEKRPECNRCKIFGTSCHYTPQNETSSSRSHSRRVASFVPIQPKLPSLLTYSPSASIPGDEAERRYFELFREKVAFDLCGYFGTSFWTHLIPQECHREPAVRHAIFALSALYKSSAPKVDALDANDKHLKFALMQHSKAISYFRKRLSKGEPQVRLALMASLLFGSFESFHGNCETASQQIYSGLNILGQWQKSRLLGQTAQTITAIDPELIVALQRLRLQLEAFLAMNTLNDHPFTEAEDEEVIEGIPLRFTSLPEAFPSALKIAINTSRHLRKAFRCGNRYSSRKLLVEERDYLKAAVDQWKRSFRPVLLEVETGQNIAIGDYLGVFQLQACVMNFSIILSTSMSKEEVVYDRFTDQFRRIVSLSRRLLQMDRARRSVDEWRAQFGLGMVMALYYVATRCRNSLIRRDAITTLREWPCRNGIWDSLQAALVAEWIVEIEEEQSDGDKHIPEEARVRMNSLKVARENGGIKVECLQGPPDGIMLPRGANLVFS